MILDATIHPFFSAGSIRGERVLAWLETARPRAERGAADAPPRSADTPSTSSDATAGPVLVLYEGSSPARRTIDHEGALSGDGSARRLPV